MNLWKMIIDFLKSRKWTISRSFQWTGSSPEKPTVIEPPPPEKKMDQPKAPFITLRDFIEAIQPFAKDVEAKSAIPWLIIAAQAAHESGNGNSKLTIRANNLFGITGDRLLKMSKVSETLSMPELKTFLSTHDGTPVMIMKTNEYSPLPPEKIQYWTRPGDVVSKVKSADGGSDLVVERPFRTYQDWSESLTDWTSLILRLYPEAYEAATHNDPQGFFQGLQAGGYATDKKYAAKLTERYGAAEAVV